MTHEGRALLTWKRYGVFLDRVDVVQRQENKDQRCLQHVCRRSHPLNWSVRSRATLLSCSVVRRFFGLLSGFGVLSWCSFLLGSHVLIPLSDLMLSL